MRKAFTGPFAESIQGVLDQKHAAGYVFKTGELMLHRFDSFTELNYKTAIELTEEIVLAWIRNPCDYSNQYQGHRISTVNSVAVYLRGHGQHAFIYPNALRPKSIYTFNPHIYSKDELREIFAAADRIEQKISPVKPITISTVLRLIYCCGLRPIEALRLKMGDVDLEGGILNVLQAKGRKDRDIPMSTEMTSLMRRFNSKMDSLIPNRKWFFQPSENADGYSRRWIDNNFKKIVDECGIKTNAGKSPRLYDLRHTFATNCIQNWIDSGEDVNAMLPLLSAYMGHSEISGTAYYIHLLPSDFQNQSEKSTTWYSDVLGEMA